MEIEETLKSLRSGAAMPISFEEILAVTIATFDAAGI
jgi:hypothetical protein